MSEQGGAAPHETALLAGQVPRSGEAVSAPAHSPGLSLGAARVPGGPTFPEPDPASLSLVFAQYANELFAVPPLSPEPGHPAPPPSPSLPGAPALSPSTPDAHVVDAPAPTALAVPEAHPFDAPLAFDRIDDSALHGRIPFAVGAPTPGGSSAPSFFAPDEGALPYWAPRADVPDGASALAVPFEIEPAPRSEEARADTAAPAPSTRSREPFDANAIRREFPILNERVNGKRLVWLDNAATTQKPQAVIDRLSWFYEHENSNVHRAAHTLAARATDAYESAREAVRRTLHAPSKSEIVFVRGTTEGINFVARSWGGRNVRRGDEIVLTHLEHHANIVPWQLLAADVGAIIRVAPVDETGQIILEEYEKLLSEKTKIVSFPQVSNALGTITPAREMITLAHRHGAKVLLDGAQGISHMPVDVQALDCDFYVFSGHKVFAPTGIGAVFGRSELLDAMPPWQGGGNMIEDVTFERTRYQPPPARFEAGTGNIADAVGLGAALDWLTRVGLENVGAYEHELLEYATERLRTVPGLRMIGTAKEKAAVLSFILAGQKTEEIGGILDQEGIAVRSGHHCAQPILRRFGVEATVRASLAPYNTHEDVDALVAALHRLQAGQSTRARA